MKHIGSVKIAGIIPVTIVMFKIIYTVIKYLNLQFQYLKNGLYIIAEDIVNEGLWI